MSLELIEVRPFSAMQMLFSNKDGVRARRSPPADPPLAARDDLDFCADENESMRDPTGAFFGRRAAAEATGKRAGADSFRSADLQRWRSRRCCLLLRGSAKNAQQCSGAVNRMEAR
jgi:hypothetical protein